MDTWGMSDEERKTTRAYENSLYNNLVVLNKVSEHTDELIAEIKRFETAVKDGTIVPHSYLGHLYNLVDILTKH